MAEEPDVLARQTAAVYGYFRLELKVYFRTAFLDPICRGLLSFSKPVAFAVTFQAPALGLVGAGSALDLPSGNMT